jgi:hypothetical protein
MREVIALLLEAVFSDSRRPTQAWVEGEGENEGEGEDEGDALGAPVAAADRALACAMPVTPKTRLAVTATAAAREAMREVAALNMVGSVGMCSSMDVISAIAWTRTSALRLSAASRRWIAARDDRPSRGGLSSPLPTA